MGFGITYIAGKKKLYIDLSSTDIQIVEHLGKKGFDKEMTDVFGVCDFVNKTPVKKADLAKSIDTILKTVKGDNEILPRLYKLERKVDRVSKV